MVGTKIVKTPFYLVGLDVLQEAYRVIKNCGIVVGPTDTLYGVFADPFRDECVEKVYVVKKRKDKPIPILASSINAVAEIVELTPALRLLLEFIWPGPVTVLLKPSTEILSAKIHPGTEMIGFRVPASPFARKLAEMNGGFITGTSANISGLKPARTAEEAVAQLGEGVDLYIDSGPSPLGKPSTVIAVENNKVKILRESVVSTTTVEALYRLALKVSP